MRSPHAILLALLLAGCNTTSNHPLAERLTPREEMDRRDHATCESYGTRRGQPAYADCRHRVAAARDRRYESWQRAMSADNGGGELTCEPESSIGLSPRWKCR